MSRYHVVIMGREAPELLTREGYASKGEARRAWATAARGAVLLENGVAIDEKTGTTKTTAAALRRFAAKLKLDVDDPVIDEELEEAAPPPMPAKGFEFDDQPDKGFFEASTSVEVTHAIAPDGAVHQGDDTERLAPARPPMCSKCSAEPRRRSGKRTPSGQETWGAKCRKADCERRRKLSLKPPGRATAKAKRRPVEVEPLSLTTLRTLVEEVLRRDVELIVRSDSAVLRCVASGPIATGATVTELVREVLPKVSEELDGARGRLRLAEDRVRAVRGEVEQVELACARLRAAGGA